LHVIDMCVVPKWCCTACKIFHFLNRNDSCWHVCRNQVMLHSVLWSESLSVRGAPSGRKGQTRGLYWRVYRTSSGDWIRTGGGEHPPRNTWKGYGEVSTFSGSW
jgi:hypothetical protein